MSKSNKFHSCCGRNIQLPHASICTTTAPTLRVVEDNTLTIKRVGARIEYTRASGSGTLRFRVVSVAKQAERAIRANPAKLDECIAMMRAGVWS